MKEEKDITSKLEDWVNSEGIPLEYYTSSVFLKNSFRVSQGRFVDDNGTPREIDIAAFDDFKLGNTTLRIYSIVECKWSKEKPWIVFTSPTTKMSKAAHISQSFGSLVGSSVLWHIAGEEEVNSLSLFDTNKPSGFSGRQAFTKDSDLFYNAVQSLITKTVLSLRSYDSNIYSEAFDFIAIGFPLIVIDGSLFESKYNMEEDKVELIETKHSKIHWKGSKLWKSHATVDIITKEYLPTYVALIKSDFASLAKISAPAIQNIKDFYLTKKIETLNPKEGSRGIVGLPSFLYNILNNTL